MECYNGNISIHEEWVSCDQDSNHFSGHGHYDHGLDLEIPTPNESNSCVMDDDQILVYGCSFYNQTINATDSLPYPCNQSKDQGDSSLAQGFSDDDALEEFLNCFKEDDETPLKRKYEMLQLPKALEDQGNSRKLIDNNPKKKTRLATDHNKNLPPNYQTANSKSEAESEDDSVDLNVKTLRAGRGAATDPQSIYARKRRERINQRLGILQNLVPNGTKVDISTMLEEAVHYVNFLQLQIKLLSCDDMWMYAPIAYNMGLYQNISPTLPFSS